MTPPTDWLLLRGLSRERRHFGSFPDAFAAATGARAHTLDLPGFGEEHGRLSPSTMAEIVDDLRARFLAVRPVGARCGVLAVSLGGMVALDWCARHKDDFSHAVIINSSASDLSPPLERFAWRMGARLPALLLSSPLARERVILEITSNLPAAEKEPIAQRWAGFYAERPPSTRSFARQLTAAIRWRRPTSAPDAHVLVLASTADRLVRSVCSEKLARALGAPLVLHDAGGHDLSLDAPEWICRQVIDFVGSSEAPRAAAG